MDHNRIRAILALTVVGVFMGITAFMAIFPLTSKQQVDLTIYSDFFAKTSSVYTGIIGVIIGYYFARTPDKTAKPENPEPGKKPDE
jgi:hypothetical protein